MRAHLFRTTLTWFAAMAFATTAFAQAGMLKGTILDAEGNPVEGATIVMRSENSAREIKTTSDDKGEFIQIGLRSGAYDVTASKDGVGSASTSTNIRQGGRGTSLTFNLSATSSLSAGDREMVEGLQAAFAEASAASAAGDHALAITKYNEAIAISPDCADCYVSIGYEHSDLEQWDDAETAFKKAIDLDSNNGDAYNGLAAAYNALKKYDLAQEAGAKAASLSPAAGGGGAEQAYNQGVILFNGQKFADAKTQFEAAVAADPQMALAQYQLGMTALNLGQIPEAVTALEAYLAIEPNGEKAAEVNAALPALKAMVK